MPLSLTTPVARTSGTTWRLVDFHVLGIESPGTPRLLATFHLVDAGGEVIGSATFEETDWPAFQAAAGGAQLNAVRRAVIDRAKAAAPPVLGAGSTT